MDLNSIKGTLLLSAYDIKAQDWYIEAKRKLDFKLGYIKMLIVLDVVLLVAVYLIVGF